MKQVAFAILYTHTHTPIKVKLHFIVNVRTYEETRRFGRKKRERNNEEGNKPRTF